MVAGWPDEVETVLSGDLAVVLADVTPARGVVLTPLTNFALHDRGRGTITVLSSLGAWRKLNRIRSNPQVALAFHTRRHGFAARSHYVLAQGVAWFSTTPDHQWLESIDANWTRFMGPRDRGFPWEWWTDAYQWQRIGVRIDVTRVLVWDDLAYRGTMAVPATMAPSSSQSPPSGAQ